jgi:hypothetical protein
MFKHVLTLCCALLLLLFLTTDQEDLAAAAPAPDQQRCLCQGESNALEPLARTVAQGAWG